MAENKDNLQTEVESSRKKNNLLAVLVVILVVLNFVQWYMRSQNDEKNQAMLESKEMELVSTYAKLDSISKQLDNKIEELILLNENVDSLILVKEQLEKEKQELKMAKNIAQNRYAEIKDRVEVYESLLKKKDKEISRLKEVNQELLTENIGLKEEKVGLKDKINDLEFEQGQMKDKISAASYLEASNIRMVGVFNGGKEKEDIAFKGRKLQQLKIKFNISENDLAKLGAKTFRMRLIDPEGATLYNVAAGSGTFKDSNDLELFFTMKKEILFDNSKQEVIFEYNLDSDLKKGNYKVEIYHDSEMMGKSSFIIK